MKEIPEKMILQNIKNGASINSQAKKYDVRWERIKNLCKKNNIESEHKNKKITDTMILELIKANKAMTEGAIRKSLNMSSSRNLFRRLRQLVMDKKLQTVIISRTRTRYKNKEVLYGYTERHLFYISMDDLSTFIEKKIPKLMPTHLRRAITYKLNNIGIPIQLSKPSAEYRPVAFPLDQYEKLQVKAKKENLSIRELILKYTLN